MEAVDGGDVAALVLLDLSAAFDTVDHSILCKRLQLTFGLDGQVFGMVPFLSSWPFAVCSSWHAEVSICAACLRSSSGFGIGPNLVYIVHC